MSIRMAGTQVLITGGAGFIGCRLSEALLAEGCEVVVLDSLHPQVHQTVGRPSRLPMGVTLVPFDVTTSAPWDAVLRLGAPEVVYHLAAETGTGQSLRESSRHGRTNVVGTTEMLDAFSRAGEVPGHIVLTSSRAVYGEGEWTDGKSSFFPIPRSHQQLVRGEWDPVSPEGKRGRPLPSEAGKTEPRPVNIYGATKLAQEQILEAWCNALACPLTILRLQNVYGDGQSLGNPYTGVLSLFARSAVGGQAIDVYEDGNIIRDFVFIDDVVRALVLALSSIPEAGISRKVDIGSGVPTTILEVASEIAEMAGCPAPIVSGHFRDGDVRAASCTIDAARKTLGFAAERTLEEGLESLLSFVRQECK